MKLLKCPKVRRHKVRNQRPGHRYSGCDYVSSVNRGPQVQEILPLLALIQPKIALTKLPHLTLTHPH